MDAIERTIAASRATKLVDDLGEQLLRRMRQQRPQLATREDVSREWGFFSDCVCALFDGGGPDYHEDPVPATLPDFQLWLVMSRQLVIDVERLVPEARSADQAMVSFQLMQGGDVMIVKRVGATVTGEVPGGEPKVWEFGSEREAIEHMAGMGYDGRAENWEAIVVR